MTVVYYVLRALKLLNLMEMYEGSFKNDVYQKWGLRLN